MTKKEKKKERKKDSSTNHSGRRSPVMWGNAEGIVVTNT
jgi:hypothetical protein